MIVKVVKRRATGAKTESHWELRTRLDDILTLRAQGLDCHGQDGPKPGQITFVCNTNFPGWAVKMARDAKTAHPGES
jgi:hypothetical protein